jgi:hypothetical protein
MTVTPEMAAHWLENANDDNRFLSEPFVARLARDIRAGQWKLTHEGIAFDVHGRLIDGQHRLWAVVQAEIPVRMYVWLNVAPESLMVINIGRPRSLADNLRLSGNCKGVSKNDLATLRAMLARGGSLSLTPSEAAAHLERHRDAVVYAGRHLPQVSGVRGLSTGETRAVVARAYYSADRQRLEQFCQVLRTSVATGDHDKAAIRLRSYLSTTVGSSQGIRQERYRKTQRALRAFLRGHALTRLSVGDGELFPLPEETNP